MLEVTAVQLRKCVNVRLDLWAKIMKTDPRDCISQEEILIKFASKHSLSDAGCYYITGDDIEQFCEYIWELMTERKMAAALRLPYIAQGDKSKQIQKLNRASVDD